MKTPLKILTLVNPIAFPSQILSRQLKATQGKGVASSDDLTLTLDTDLNGVVATARGRYLLIPSSNIASMEVNTEPKAEPTKEKGGGKQ